MSSCDSLTIVTDSDDTKLIMYQYSGNILFDAPSGYTGYNLDCDPNDAYILLKDDDYEAFISVEDSVQDIIGNLPCQDVTFKCLQTESCSMQYMHKNHSYEQFEDVQPYFNCHGPIYFEQLFDIHCVGTCPLSPTPSPTIPGSIIDLSFPPTVSPTFPLLIIQHFHQRMHHPYHQQIIQLQVRILIHILS